MICRIHRLLFFGCSARTGTAVMSLSPLNYSARTFPPNFQNNPSYNQTDVSIRKSQKYEKTIPLRSDPTKTKTKQSNKFKNAQTNRPEVIQQTTARLNNQTAAIMSAKSCLNTQTVVIMVSGVNSQQSTLDRSERVGGLGKLVRRLS